MEVRGGKVETVTSGFYSQREQARKLQQSPEHGEAFKEESAQTKTDGEDREHQRTG